MENNVQVIENQELVKVENNQVVVDSRSIAEHFGKRHDKLLHEINRMYGDFCAEVGMPKMVDTPMFYKTTYLNKQNGQEYPMYIMTRDGFSLLVMGFTGKKALEWKIKYIEAFNEMERALSNKSTISPAELSLRKDEVTLRKSELWMKLADRANIPEFKQIADTYAANTLAGKEIVALPEVNKKTYSATDIGNILGVSSNKIGRLSKQLNMKVPEYGKFFYDKAKGCNKQIETFRYYENAIDVFRDALEEA